MSDSSILYAFLIAVFGCLLSVTAGLVAALQHLFEKRRFAAAKPQHALVALDGAFYSMSDPQSVRIMGARRFPLNRLPVPQFQPDVPVPFETKPLGHFGSLSIKQKNDRIYQRLHFCTTG